MACSEPVAQTSAIERCYVNSGHSYESTSALFEASIGRLERETVESLLTRKAPWPEVEAEMARMAGPSGLMLFDKFDQGAVAARAGEPINCRMYLVGNPAIAAQIVRIDVRASLCVPFRVAVYEPAGRSGPSCPLIGPVPFSVCLMYQN